MDSPQHNAGATEEQIREAQAFSEVTFPEDYAEWLRKSNGARGPIGISNYIDLWPVESIKTRNDQYSVSAFAPGLLLIGSDGGNEAYGIDFRKPRAVFVSIPLVGMSWSAAKMLSHSFDDFWAFLSKT